MPEPVEGTIEVNQVYKLMPAMTGKPRKLCFVAGRQGNAITLLLVSGIATATVLQFEREFAKVKTRDGVYNLMPCNRVTDIKDVADVCDIIRNTPDEY